MSHFVVWKWDCSQTDGHILDCAKRQLITLARHPFSKSFLKLLAVCPGKLMPIVATICSRSTVPLSYFIYHKSCYKNIFGVFVNHKNKNMKYIYLSWLKLMHEFDLPLATWWKPNTVWPFLIARIVNCKFF